MIKEFISNITKNKSVNIVFLGDSVTHGYFESHENMHGTTDYEAVYHNRLKNKIKVLFPEKDINIINSGIGGDTAFGALKRIENDVIKHNPDLAVVCFGLNDINADNEDMYINPLKKIFTELNSNGIPTIFMTPNMLNTKPVSGFLNDYSKTTASYQNGGKFDRFISLAIDMAKSENVYVCDCYKKWKILNSLQIDTDKLLANGVNHPTREMHSLFADSLFETIFFDNK